MPTPYDTFLASLEISYDQWHDGVGFDLSALDHVTPQQRQAIEKLLIARAGKDWRYLEALGHLATPAAKNAIGKVAQSSGPHAIYAARLMARETPDAARELIIQQLLRRIRTLVPDASVSELIDTAAENPTPAVKAALLDATLYSRNVNFRCHAAALLYYLAGLAKEPFDFAHRPFFLQFTSPIPSVVAAAHRELRSKIP